MYGHMHLWEGVRDEQQGILAFFWEFPRHKLLRYHSGGQENLTADSVGNVILFTFFFVAISNQYQWAHPPTPDTGLIAFATVRFSTPPSSPSSLPLTLLGLLCCIWLLFTLVAFMGLDLAVIAFGKACSEFCSMAADMTCEARCDAVH